MKYLFSRLGVRVCVGGAVSANLLVHFCCGPRLPVFVVVLRWRFRTNEPIEKKKKIRCDLRSSEKHHEVFYLLVMGMQEQKPDHPIRNSTIK